MTTYKSNLGLCFIHNDPSICSLRHLETRWQPRETANVGERLQRGLNYAQKDIMTNFRRYCARFKEWL